MCVSVPVCLCVSSSQKHNETEGSYSTWMLWAGLQINGESPGQHEMTGLLCKLRSSDTALDRQREKERERERAGTASHATLSVGRPFCVCLVNTHYLR